MSSYDARLDAAKIEWIRRCNLSIDYTYSNALDRYFLHETLGDCYCCDGFYNSWALRAHWSGPLHIARLYDVAVDDVLEAMPAIILIKEISQ